MLVLRVLCIVAALAAAAVTVQAQPDPMEISFWSSGVPPLIYQARTLTTPIIDPSNNIYMVAGAYAANVSTNDAWMSSDLGSTWVCQSCLNTDPSKVFTPRDSAGFGADQAGTLYMIGGIEDTDGPEQHAPEMWNSTDQGITWNLMTNAGPWNLQAEDGAPFILFDSSDNMWVLGGGHLWFAANDGLYNDFIDKGAITLGSEARVNYGAYMTQDNHIWIAGGMQVQGGPLNDVWSADISAATVAFQLVTANAPWSPRVAPSIAEDAFGNLYIYGQYASPEGEPAADLMWVSPNPTDETTVRGVNWVRVDGRDCASTYPFPVATVPGYFDLLVDGKQRMLLVGAGVEFGANPTGNSSTAMIQLLSDPSDFPVNEADGLVQWSACSPTPPGPTPDPDPKPHKPGKGGMSGGATAAVVIFVLLFVGALVAAFIYRARLALWWAKIRSRNGGINAGGNEFQQTYQTM